jgi:hypothetical protein
MQPVQLVLPLKEVPVVEDKTLLEFFHVLGPGLWVDHSRHLQRDRP